MDGGSQTWFYRALEAIAACAPRGATLPDRLRSLADAAFVLADELGDASPDRPSRECRAGCAFCCHYLVRVTPPEALAIAHTIRGDHALRSRIAEQARTPRRSGERRPCALLDDDGRCEVYPVRPLGCRGWTSASRDACELEHGGRLGAPLPDQPNHCVCLGLAAGLAEASERLGAPSAQDELAVAVDAALRYLNADLAPD